MKMHNVKHYMLMAIVLMAGLSYGCQKTPDALIVQNKTGEALDEAISVEASAEPQQTAKQPKHTNQALVSDDGIVSVVIDADVVLPEVDQIPVARIEKNPFTQEKVDRMMAVLFRGAQLYDTNVETKADIEWQIVRLEQSASDLNSDLAQSNGIDNLVDLREYADKEIAKRKKQLADAVDEKPMIDKVDVSQPYSSGIGGYVRHDMMANVFYTNSGVFNLFQFNDFGDAFYPQDLYLQDYDFVHSAELDQEDAGFNLGKTTALALVESMDIEDIALKKAYVYEELKQGEGIGELTGRAEASGLQYYVYCFFRQVNGVCIDNAFYQGTHSEGDAVTEPWPYERLEIWTETTGGLVMLKWESPAKIKQIENTNVQIQTDIDDAIAVMQQEAYETYISYMGEKCDSVRVEIDRIELTLARIKEKDTGQYLVVPVWDFYGKVLIQTDALNGNTRQPKEGDYYRINGYLKHNSLFTVNALDGKSINRLMGY